MVESQHAEKHLIERSGWLRATVLGANDGLVSTASLLVGFAASNASDEDVLLAGFAGMVAGAMSMACGEYVSVASQRDIEHADLTKERSELEKHPEREHRELANIYLERGLDRELAERVAEQMMAHDALGAHARDELGITPELRARPLQAAVASAGAFAVGAMAPLTVTWLGGHQVSPMTIAGATLGFLALLGAVGARAGGAHALRPTLRVLVGGGLAMAATAIVGGLFGAVG